MYCLRGLRDWGIRAISLLLDEVLREHELVLLVSNRCCLDLNTQLRL